MVASPGIFAAKGWHLGADRQVFLVMAETWAYLSLGYMG